MNMGRARQVDDVEIGDLWREYRRAQQERRASRLGPRTDEILALKGKGFDVRVLTDYQFRIDGTLDLFPIHRRYHDLTTQTRGGYRNAMDVAIRRLRSRATHNKETAMADDPTEDAGKIPDPPPPATDTPAGDKPEGEDAKTDPPQA